MLKHFKCHKMVVLVFKLVIDNIGNDIRLLFRVDIERCYIKSMASTIIGSKTAANPQLQNSLATPSFHKLLHQLLLIPVKLPMPQTFQFARPFRRILIFHTFTMIDSQRTTLALNRLIHC